MAIAFTSAHLVGLSSKRQWAQTYHGGQLFIILEYEALDENQDACASGKALLETLLKKISEVNPQRLAELTQVVQQALPGEQAGRYSGVIGLFIEDILYAVVVSSGTILLARADHLAPVLEGSGNVSGRVQSGDTIFFISQRLQEIVSHDVLAQTLKLSPAETAEQLAPLLHTGVAPTAAGIIARVHKLEEATTDEALPTTTGKRLHYPVFHNLREKLPGVKEAVKLRLVQLSKRQRFIASLLAVLIPLFIVSSIVGWQHRTQTARKQSVVVQFERIKHKLEEGKALIDINNQRARAVLTEVHSEAKDLVLQVKNDKTEAKRAQLLLEEIERAAGEAAKMYTLTDAALFYDLNLIKNGAQASEMSIYHNTLVTLDGKNGAVYTLGVDNKRAEIIAGGDRLSGPVKVAVQGDTAFVLTDKGVVGIPLLNKEAAVVIARDDAWGIVAAMDAFAGNIYLVDATHNTIWKYQAIETGFSDRITYLPDDGSHSFGESTALAIDGAVWTITHGKIIKFMQGKPIGEFNLSGFDMPLSADSTIYTADSLPALYFLDRGHKRIVVADKEGVYQSQYLWDKIEEVSSLVVAPERKKILLLSKDKIYGIDLRE